MKSTAELANNLRHYAAVLDAHQVGREEYLVNIGLLYECATRLEEQEKKPAEPDFTAMSADELAGLINLNFQFFGGIRVHTKPVPAEIRNLDVKDKDVFERLQRTALLLYALNQRLPRVPA